MLEILRIIKTQITATINGKSEFKKLYEEGGNEKIKSKFLKICFVGHGSTACQYLDFLITRVAL